MQFLDAIDARTRTAHVHQSSHASVGAPSVLTRPYYERLHALEEAHGWSRGMRAYAEALLTPLLKRKAVSRVLDLGCGTGSMLSWLSGYSGVRVTGIDLSRDALGFCQARGHRELTEGSATTLPFQAETFDLVFCADVLQHLPNPPGDATALTEAARVLRPGGYLYLRTNSGCGERSGPATESDAYRRYKRADLAERVARAGFLVERSTYANALPALPMIVRRSLSVTPNGHVPHVDAGLARTLRPNSLRWIDSLLALVLQVEAWAVGGVKAELPLGGSLLILARRAESAGKGTHS